jgi:hypothetical protein
MTESDRREILRRLIESCGSPTGAWIAPDGRCYPCPNGGHHYLADLICEGLGLGGPRLDLDGPDLFANGDPAEHLMRLGWGRVMAVAGGIVLTEPVSRRLTKHQMNALFDLARQRPELAEGLLLEIRRRAA